MTLTEGQLLQGRYQIEHWLACGGVIMQQICAALACLRNQPPPIVHRAVTPHNIIGVTASRLRANL